MRHCAWEMWSVIIYIVFLLMYLQQASYTYDIYQEEFPRGQIAFCLGRGWYVFGSGNQVNNMDYTPKDSLI